MAWVLVDFFLIFPFFQNIFKRSNKKVIEYLEKIPGKKKKDVADLGCGKARVCEHFLDSERFKFINMDHVSCNDIVKKHDIKDTGLDEYSMDIVVLSLAMWGSNCKEYIT